MLLAEGLDIGLATVYRVLTQFEQAGLLVRHHFESGKAVFELNQGKHHDHLVCMQCGRVEEFYDARDREAAASRSRASAASRSASTRSTCTPTAPSRAARTRRAPGRRSVRGQSGGTSPGVEPRIGGLAAVEVGEAEAQQEERGEVGDARRPRSRRASRPTFCHSPAASQNDGGPGEPRTARRPARASATTTLPRNGAQPGCGAIEAAACAATRTAAPRSRRRRGSSRA